MGLPRIAAPIASSLFSPIFKLCAALPLTWIFPQNVEKKQNFYNQRGKNVVSMEKPWKFEIGVKEKTWILNFPLLRKKQTPIFLNQRGKNVIFDDFYGKIRGVVHSQIRCTDFKSSKKILRISLDFSDLSKFFCCFRGFYK